MDSINKRVSDPSEIRAKKISQGRQDLQDYIDRRAFGQRAMAISPQAKKIQLIL
jgi:hypothetical protein